jgi:cyclic pyranopterin phosphate synthase
MSSDRGLSHVDRRGQASMVNVVAKPPTHRVARASCAVRMGPTGAKLLRDEAGADILSTARMAGLEGAKRTAAWIPLCHPLRIDAIRVEISTGRAGVTISASAETVDRTGVEMEALTACACAALSIVRAVLALDPGVRVDDLVLLHKSGGRSGTWNR